MTENIYPLLTMNFARVHRCWPGRPSSRLTRRLGISLRWPGYSGPLARQCGRCCGGEGKEERMDLRIYREGPIVRPEGPQPRWKH